MKKTSPPHPGTDDFWDLGQPRPRLYEKASFSPDSVGVTDVADEKKTDAGETPAVPQAEKIPPRSTHFVTHSYRSGTAPHGSSAPNPVRTPAPDGRTYQPPGTLIRSVTVLRWQSTASYGRFDTDARRLYHAKPPCSPDTPLPAVPYVSYGPQYAHMNREQLGYYLWLRENIRLGRYPPCDFAYLQLYIYEILNLPGQLPPEEGVHRLAALWLACRNEHPRLDALLCDWFPDYCLAHACPMPPELLPLLPAIVPKANFKEFYFHFIPPEQPEILAETLLEVLSDHDYRRSRYYTLHAQAYDEHMPQAVSAALQEAQAEKRGIFRNDHLYHMTRDSFSGAIVTPAVRNRLSLTYNSFTRAPQDRLYLTALAKYAENQLRTMLGIKSRLGIPEMDPADIAAIDRYFAPRLPVKKTVSPEDRYMPPDYMKNYEAETSGFDVSAAQDIEKASWSNTERLTADLSPAPAEKPPEAPAEPDITPDSVENIPEPDEKPAGTPEGVENSADDGIVNDALRAALRGEYRTFCREHRLYEGELADRINTIFLEEWGDVVLENTGGGFALLEDYREDIEAWLT